MRMWWLHWACIGCIFADRHLQGAQKRKNAFAAFLLRFSLAPPCASQISSSTSSDSLMRLRGKRLVMRHYESSEDPSFPSGALIVEVPNGKVWAEEKLEFDGLKADPRTPPSLLQAYISSNRTSSGMYWHAFDGKGKSLSEFPWSYGSLSDSSRLNLIFQLLEGVDFWHRRGCPHLGLDAESVNILLEKRSDYRAQLRLLSLGASVELNAKNRTTYQLEIPEAFRPPEILNVARAQAGLKALFDFDAWSIGILVAMIAGSLNASPFEADPDLRKWRVSKEQAVLGKIDDVEANFGRFLTDLDDGSRGFLFRHGWVVKLITGLLEKDPKRRTTVFKATQIARQGIRQRVAGAKAQAEAVQVRTAAKDDTQYNLTREPPTLFEISNATMVSDSFGAYLLDGIEPYRSLEAIVSMASRGDLFVVAQKPKFNYHARRYGFTDVRNYGEIVGFRNRADGDRWDIFVPGLQYDLPRGMPLRLKSVLGIVMIKGGNHKLAVTLAPPHRAADTELIAKDVKNFMAVYKSVKGKLLPKDRIYYLALEDPS